MSWLWTFEGFVLGVAVSTLGICILEGSVNGIWSGVGAVLATVTSMVALAAPKKGEGEGGEQVLGSDGREGARRREQRSGA